MKQTRLLMGMPITVEVVDATATEVLFDLVFGYFQYVDEKFSTYKDTSEISRINRHELTLAQASDDMQLVFALAELTRRETDGFFDIGCQGRYDPSGLVKGWSIHNAAEILRQKGFQNYYVDAGGDIQAAGKNSRGQNWQVGIQHPFNTAQIVKVVSIGDGAVATSGTYVRGQHIYDPRNGGQLVTDVVSLTVIGPDIYDADRFATAAFAMGRAGIGFIERLAGYEGYQIDEHQRATWTSGFERYVSHD